VILMPSVAYQIAPDDEGYWADQLKKTIEEPETRLAIHQHMRQLFHEAMADLSQEDHRRVLQNVFTFKGWWLVVAAAKAHSILYPGKVISTSDIHSHETPQDAIAHVLRCTVIPHLDEQERAAFIAELSQLPRSSLECIFPAALQARYEILEVLGWQDASLFVDDIAAIVEVDRYSSNWLHRPRDLDNSPDSELGSIDYRSVKAHVELAGLDRSREVFKLFKDAKLAPNAIMLSEAIFGWNRAQIEKRILKRSQPAIKAYGYLPLERGIDEALERYLFLKQFAKESSKFGPQRQANERAAVQVALKALTQVAGFADLSRFEWDMEARIAGDVVPDGRQWELGEYTMTFSLQGKEPEISVTKGGKALKSLPKSVRDDEHYIEIKEVVTQAKAQMRRFKATFENMMVMEQKLTLDDLRNLGRMPVAGDLLSRLIVITDDSVVGLCLPEMFAVLAVDGKQHPITHTIQIAHPYHLYQQDILAVWQREVIHRRIVQPFKQAFRELYLLTPAERQTGYFSNRFFGHQVSGAVATRLFQSRGWEIVSDEMPLPRRVFHDQKIQAHFIFPDAMHYLSSMPTITSDRISFWPYPGSFYIDQPGSAERAIPLADVPPLLFSEVMRDADLIVSVGQSEGDSNLSPEAYAQRGQLVTSLLADLSLPGVRIEGHFAYVKGKLADYRVHLGSAVIHIDPGNYLCIVPDRWGKTHDRLFLPFADASDAKISEVISKILLLLQDDKIKDGSILSQINRGR
jgi:hypothetical protein